VHLKRNSLNISNHHKFVTKIVCHISKKPTYKVFHPLLPDFENTFNQTKLIPKRIEDRKNGTFDYIRTVP